MPIYSYGCSSCGLKQDVMQKMSDSPLTVCPECGAQTFSKQLTAASFQLKGKGYYATDFKNGTQPKAEPACAPCAAAGSCPAANIANQ
ncbi:MAG: FmdB family zinc ribbon protein [Gallionella sp.]